MAVRGDCDVRVGALSVAERPHALEAVVERALQPVGGAMPQPHAAILAAGQDDGQLRVEHDCRDVVCVAL